MEAFFSQLFVWVLLQLLPFRKIKDLFQQRADFNREPGLQVLDQIRNATVQANLLSFWKNKCLVQSLAARWMLNRRKISSTLALSVKMDSRGKFVAHASLKVNDFEIVKSIEDYLEIYRL